MERKLILSPAAGFTLIELLVAVAVMAVLTLGAVLAAGRGQVAKTAPDMALFMDRFSVAQALAVEGRRTGGLDLRPEGTQLMWLVRGEWNAQTEPVPWRGRVEFNRRRLVAGRGEPEILFLPNGQSTPFTISFPEGQCENDGWTGLRCTDD